MNKKIAICLAHNIKPQNGGLTNAICLKANVLTEILVIEFIDLINN